MSNGVILSCLEESPITTLTTLLTLVLTYKFIIYPFFLNPLHSIPGPLLYKITDLFALNDQRIESRNVKVHTLHQKYGSVVQLSPNEISLSTLSSLKQIYIKENFPKSSFYAQFQNFGAVNAFSTLPSVEHIKRKRLMAKLYSKSAVFSQISQQHINNKVNNLLNFVTGRLGKEIDVYELFNSLAMDVVTFYEFGSKFSTNLLLDLEARDIIKAFRASSSMWFYTTLAPQFWDYAADKDTAKRSVQCREWVRSKFLEAYESMVEEGGDDGSVIKTLYEKGVDKMAIGSELFDHTAAGHETTGTSLAYCCWELSRPSNWYIQDAINKELVDNFGEPTNNAVDLEKLDKLKYLDAVLLETTRLHAAIPGSEPREVQSNYSVELSNGSQVKIPKGTIVSVQPWTIHRDPAVFSDPDRFIPERWLPSAEDNTPEEYEERVRLMKSMIFAFGQGNRMCLGMNLAVSEMKLAIAQLYWRYNSRISSDWCKTVVEEPVDVLMGNDMLKGKKKSEMNDVQLMSMADSYTSRPMFDECWLVWEERKNDPN